VPMTKSDSPRIPAAEPAAMRAFVAFVAFRLSSWILCHPLLGYYGMPQRGKKWQFCLGLKQSLADAVRSESGSPMTLGNAAAQHGV
jgi:hypothetical protein